MDLCSGSSIGGVSEPVGSGQITEEPVGATEGPGEVTGGPEGSTGGPPATSPNPEMGENCEELIVDKNGWSGNWNGKLKILLSSDVSQYTISFTTDIPVSSLSFWEGQLSGSGTSFTLQSPSYFAGKNEGEYLEHGFQLSYSGDTEPKFTSITLNGVDLCSGGSPGSATEVAQTSTGGATDSSTVGPGAVTGGPSGGCLEDKIYYDHGEVTAYGNNPTGGHCGFTELPSAEARKHFVAISSQDDKGWKDGLYCGSCVRLRYTDGHVSQIVFTLSLYLSQELIGYIHDSCPSCPKYHWDLSDYMYLNLTSEQSVGKVHCNNNSKIALWYTSLTGIKPISEAEIVECPDSIVSGNLKVKVKDGSNPWWAAYQVTNAKNPINGMSLSVDGGTTWLEMVGPEEPAPSGFWFMKPSDLILNNEMENYKIRVESDTGNIVVNMAGVVASSETDSGTNNGGGEGCGGQGGLGSEGPEISSTPATEGPTGTPGATEGTEEATEEPVSGGGSSCDDLIVDKSGWTGTWQVDPIYKNI